MKSDTPETDAAKLRAIDIDGGGEFDAVHIQVPTRLERERNELHAAIRNLRDVKGRHHSEQAYTKLVAMLPESNESKP